jgi:hypothetical protein
MNNGVTSMSNKVLIASCLFIAQKVNETEEPKIRDIINAVWIASHNHSR